MTTPLSLENITLGSRMCLEFFLSRVDKRHKSYRQVASNETSIIQTLKSVKKLAKPPQKTADGLMRFVSSVYMK